MKICPKCKKQYEDNQKFCKICGVPLVEAKKKKGIGIYLLIGVAVVAVCAGAVAGVMIIKNKKQEARLEAMVDEAQEENTDNSSDTEEKSSAKEDVKKEEAKSADDKVTDEEQEKTEEEKKKEEEKQKEEEEQKELWKKYEEQEAKEAETNTTNTSSTTASSSCSLCPPWSATSNAATASSILAQARCHLKFSAPLSNSSRINTRIVPSKRSRYHGMEGSPCWLWTLLKIFPASL